MNGSILNQVVQPSRLDLDSRASVGSDGLTDAEREKLAKLYDAKTTPTDDDRLKFSRWRSQQSEA